MKTSTALLLGAGAVAAWYLLSKTTQMVGAATGAVSSALASTVEALTFSAPIQVTGYVDSTQGQTLGPIASFPAAHDAQGNTYLLIDGAYYELGPRDAAGNFTALPVVGGGAA